MKKYRVMWLLNHTTLRKFEVSQFNSIGINEVFTPKKFPYDEGNLSANVDFSLDSNLTIPKRDLDLLNSQDWYGSPSPEAWEIANRYFDVAFVAFFPDQMKSAVRNFKGAIVLRVFGHARDQKYSQLIYKYAGERLVREIKSLGHRFWFGAGYDHLHEIESNFLASRKCFLPVGLSARDTSNEWTGVNRRVFFVCPRIGSSSHFEIVYKNFKDNFGDMPHTIGGAQPVEINDPNVIGFVTRDEHERNMREHRVMFYHSQEPNHIHYHPFEAVAAGMPLVFMGGGMLDRLGGRNLPGRCSTVDEARDKVRRILKGDQKLINTIRATQYVLLDAIKAENCAAIWQSEFRRVLEELDAQREMSLPKRKNPPKIGVVVSNKINQVNILRAMLLAEAVRQGSEMASEAAEIVFLYEDNDGFHRADFDDVYELHPAIKQRSFVWKHLDSRESRRAMRYAGHDDWEPTQDHYLVIDDGIRQLQDCDLWIVVADKLAAPILPLRSVILVLNNFRHIDSDLHENHSKNTYLSPMRSVELILASTKSTYEYARQYLGVKENRVAKVPFLISNIRENQVIVHPKHSNYFVLFINFSSEFYVDKILKVLDFYYSRLFGNLDCRLVTSGSDDLTVEYLVKRSKQLMIRTKIGERVSVFSGIGDFFYSQTIARTAFLWCPEESENSVFVAAEAIRYGVPVLIVDCLPARELEEFCSIGLSFSKHDHVNMIAESLKSMELRCSAHEDTLSFHFGLVEHSVQHKCGEYWKVVRECL